MKSKISVEKSRVGFLVFLSIAFVSSLVLGYNGSNKKYTVSYGSQHGWVCPVNDDSAGKRNTWNSSANWPNADGINDPHPGRDYFTLYTSRTICVPATNDEAEAVSFPGRTLRIGGELRIMSLWGGWCNLGNNVIMLGGSQLFFHSVGSVTGSRLALEECDSTYPVYFTFNGRSDTYGHSSSKVFRPAVAAGVGSQLHLRMVPGSNADSTNGATFVMCREWPEFYGTLHMQSYDNIFAPETFSMPGNVIVEEGARFEPTAASGNSTLGGLKVCRGATLGFASVGNTQTIAVTNRLEIEAGANLDLNKFSAWTTGTPPAYPVFELSKEAYEAGVPDMTKVDNLLSKCSNKTAGIPRLKWVVEPNDHGGATMSLTYNEIVVITNNMLNNNTPFYPKYKEGYDKSSFFSDGENFHSGADYFADEKNIIMSAQSYPYVFPGDSLTITDSAFGLHGAFQCDDFVVAGNSRFRKMSGKQAYVLSGGLKFVKTAHAVRFCCGSRGTYDVQSNISGDGNIRILLDPENKTSPNAYAGVCEFKGENSGFSGRVVLEAGSTGDFKECFDDKGLIRYEPSAVSNVTLIAHGATSLGGSCGEFTFNAVTVSNQCRLALAENAVFAEPTRGWHFAGTTYLRVTNNITVTAKNTVTVGGTLVKEGAGTFMAESVVAESGCTAAIEVREGSIGAVSAEAFNGIRLSFAENCGIVVAAEPADGTFAAKGFLYCADGSEMTLPAGKLPVTVDYTGVDIADAEPVSVAVMTVADAAAEGISRKMFVRNRPSGYAYEFKTVTNGDGTSTICLEMTKKGLRVIVR